MRFSRENPAIVRAMFTRTLVWASLALAVTSAAAADAARAMRAESAPAIPGAASGAASGCLPSGNGYLRARIRGALNLDITWDDADLECEGASRPDGKGIRLSFAGPLRSDGRRLRLVFGVSGATEGALGHALPTNLTVIFEGERRLFATRGDDRCTADKLEQERIGALAGSSRSYRVVVSGFCTEPANDLAASERIVMSSFDFAGLVAYADTAPAPDSLSPPPESALAAP